MRKIVPITAGAGAALALSVLAGPVAAGAAGAHGPNGGTGGDHAVFVQTDNTAGNQIVAYDRANNGSLALANTYDTGGFGGKLNGSAVDHLASQGSLTYDPDNSLLYAVNAGSNTVSVFSVSGDQLALRQVVDSGGDFPVSVSAHGDFVYVLNAENGGSVTGFRVAGGFLHPIEGSTRALGLPIVTDINQFTHTPGDIAFSPDGSQVIVTTKAAGNSIDVFGVTPSGRLTASPVVNTEPGDVPFAVAFDAAGHLVITDAGNNAVDTFTLSPTGTATPLDSAFTGQAATCWVAVAQGYLYASNAGSASLSGYQSAPNGNLTSLGVTGTDPGTVDASASAGGQYLYVQTGGNGIVDGFQVNADGSLTALGSVLVAGAGGGEGIVAF
ncbi:MAG TPA: beta-propeller fold lactonase family protein [Acidimicrobiales bacterium]|jgi:6-phosphogluconolactonase (cycloisomerase 2 family)|nr:beta-propeller fold lactonase family protein [Acidimicrobiales bacterium]